MAEDFSNNDSKCPSCSDGILQKSKMTKLLCSDCGWESVVRPKDSEAFSEPQISTILEKFFLFLFFIAILLIIFWK